MKILNINSGEQEDVAWEVDKNGELVATFEDGSFLKFPADHDEAAIREDVAKYNQDHEGLEIITPEMEAAAEAQREQNEALVARLMGGEDVDEDPADPAQ